jgi:hypothetical protein
MYIVVTFTVRDPFHYGPYKVHICIKQYMIKPHYYNKPWQVLINLIHKNNKTHANWYSNFSYGTQLILQI